uniref:STARD3 N-terminal like n=1 Tax=Pavo cristatus TaxID=9049 RepID=A0A8C9EIJ3_PAVCR
MNRVPNDAENAHSSSVESCPSLRDVHSINPTHLMARIESYDVREKKGISDVRRTFCLFVTFDLLFITLLWIIELNVSYLFSTLGLYSLLAVFRFKVLILAYAMCRLRHWWAIAVSSTFGAFLPLTCLILVFKLLGDDVWNFFILLGFLIAQDASERAALLHPGVLSDGQFYSPPESVAGNYVLICEGFSYWH